MTKAALNVLGQNEDRLYFHVEGGAVDWAAHANDTARIIEEQMDFNHSVKAVVDWVKMHSNWDETMLLVVTDHGNAIPMGPNSDTIPFEPVESRGRGVLPGVLWHSPTHTNENTLLFAKGAGTEMLYDHIVGYDAGLALILGHNDGASTENDAIGRVMRAALAPVPLAGQRRVPRLRPGGTVYCGPSPPDIRTMRAQGPLWNFRLTPHSSPSPARDDCQSWVGYRRRMASPSQRLARNGRTRTINGRRLTIFSRGTADRHLDTGT